MARWCLVLPLLLGIHAGAVGTAAVVGAAPDGSVVAGWTPTTLAGGWGWPVVGPIIRPFDPPEDPYGTGHRGIDIAAAFGSTISTPAAGTVTFAGKVGGQLFVTIDHGEGVSSTCSWVSAVLVRKGEVVLAGASIALTGQGHPGSVVPHLHFGVRLNGEYVDPLDYLGPPPVADLIHLAPAGHEPGV